MKKIFLLIQLILGFGFTKTFTQTPTTGTNAVMEKTPREAMTTLSGATYTTVQSNIQYFDGLGRPTQVLVYKGSPDATKDIISSTTLYDAWGRAYKNILPTPSDVATGAYKSTAQTLATSFYDNDANPFSETIFETNPMNRPKQQFGAGQAWRVGAGHSVGMEYLTAGTELLHFEIRASGTIEKIGTYPASSLTCNRVTSERDFKTNEYKDRLGRVVAKSQELTAGNFAVSLYLYDDLNRLRIVIPPEAYQTVSTMASFTESSPVFLEGMFNYVYDSRGRLAEKHIPGAGTVRYVYDKNDKLVLENDDKDAASSLNYYKFTKFDALNRPIYSGLINNIGSFSRSQLQTDFDDFTGQTYETVSSSGLFGYTNISFPSNYTPAEANGRLIMHYDDYIWQTDGNYNFQASNAFHAQANAKGMTTGTIVRNLETNEWYRYVNYVDYQGRIIQQFSQNHVGGIDRIDYQYRFNGEILKMRTTHKKAGVADIIEEYIYQYDHVGRKTNFKHSLNGITQNVAKYNFDEIGRLKQKGLSPSSAIGSNQTGLWTNSTTWQGSNVPTISDQVTINTGHTVTISNGQTVSAGTLFDKGILQNFGTLNLGNSAPNTSAGTLQTIDFSYNIRGLRGINLDANNDLTNKLFSMRLDYETAGFYDGNIGKQEWKSSLDGQERSFTFSFDGGSRIKSGIYNSTKTGENYSLDNINYDFNSNITNLSRNGLKSNNIFGLIDNLNYTYQNNSNKIQKIDDASNETASFKDVASATDYTYYPDGSLKSDSNKGITLIEYNYLKKQSKITFSNGTIINYQYDANGKKLKETIGSQVTDYVGNTIYKNNLLYQIAHDEGRVVDEIYEYNINDHLGNLRVAFKDSLGIAKIVQSYAYGIWGEDLPTLRYINSLKINNFGYLNREFQVETGYTDLVNRQFDNIIGRFTSQDPITDEQEHLSLYQYGWNNPVLRSDADGLMPGCCGEFLNGVGTGFINTFKSIGNAIAHPINTLVSSGQNNMAAFKADPVGETINQAINATPLASVKEMVNFGQVLASGDNNGAGQMAGGKLAQATIVIATEGAGRVLSSGGTSVVASGETQTVYRGVNSTSPAFSAAESGIVKPRGGLFGHSSASTHNSGANGTANSKFTSWTTNPEVAKHFALYKSGNGAILETTVPRSSIFSSPNTKSVNLFQNPGKVVSESEVLLKGTINAKSQIIQN